MVHVRHKHGGRGDKGEGETRCSRADDCLEVVSKKFAVTYRTQALSGINSIMYRARKTSLYSE